MRILSKQDAFRIDINFIYSRGQAIAIVNQQQKDLGETK